MNAHERPLVGIRRALTSLLIRGIPVAFTLILLTFESTACSSTNHRHKHTSPARFTGYMTLVDSALPTTAPASSRKPSSDEAIVAARIFLFADSQYHYQFGKRTFAQSPFAERMSFEVAVRPAALDDGSDLLLALFLDEYRANYANHSLVFLGDATDLSCTHELDAFIASLTVAGVSALYPVTSNHDGFYAGNFTSKRDLNGTLAMTDMPNDWTRACSVPGRREDYRLTKGRLVSALHGLLPAGASWATALASKGVQPHAYRDAYLYYIRPLGGGDGGAPPVYGVFLDTVDYRGFALEASRGAGSVGAVSRAQLRFLDRAMFETDIASGASAVTYVLFGHHPFRGLEPKSRSRIRRFLQNHPSVVAYMSAHKHESIERNIALDDGRRVAEYIVGSTTDAPQSARIADVWIDPSSGRRWVNSRRLQLDVNALCADVSPMDADLFGYTGYRILRDATPELTVSALEKLLFAIRLDDLGTKRAVQAIGALLMENELVRAWARLYRDAPIPLDHADRAELDEIVERRYAAGNSFIELRPFLNGSARVRETHMHDAGWYDPAIEAVMQVAEQGVHRFAEHQPLIDRLRSFRTITHTARHYFTCHAAYAAKAEATVPRKRGNVMYIH